jgi:hypothetical protein
VFLLGLLDWNIVSVMVGDSDRSGSSFTTFDAVVKFMSILIYLEFNCLKVTMFNSVI